MFYLKEIKIMKNVLSSKDRQHKNEVELEFGEDIHKTITFRICKGSLIPLLDKVADVSNMSRNKVAKFVLINFLIENEIKLLEEIKKAQELGLSEPLTLDPFINCPIGKSYFEKVFGQKFKLKEDLANNKIQKDVE